MLFCCGQSFELQPIHQISLNLKLNNAVPKSADKILRDMGFTKDQINKANISANTSDGFVKEFLASQK